ncbi:hypothetical protein RDI58_019424 [Solanum bulbocastanum]|uniref:Uncharacterized protein n=1 Tax=Solanum bulbocastanum TaxID=147425 RepID=A0AAN8TBM1_SOLBU
MPSIDHPPELPSLKKTLMLIQSNRLLLQTMVNTS